MSSEQQELSLKFQGAIDAEFKFPSVSTKVTEITLDLGEVHSINSMGLRNWITWRKGLGNRVHFRFLNCPVVMVNQMNILDGFLPLGAHVESFDVPMACPACQHFETGKMVQGQDFEVGHTDRPTRINLPEMMCPNCGVELELDSIPEKYFRFLTNRHKGA